MTGPVQIDLVREMASRCHRAALRKIAHDKGLAGRARRFRYASWQVGKARKCDGRHNDWTRSVGSCRQFVRDGHLLIGGSTGAKFKGVKAKETQVVIGEKFLDTNYEPPFIANDIDRAFGIQKNYLTTSKVEETRIVTSP